MNEDVSVVQYKGGALASSIVEVVYFDGNDIDSAYTYLRDQSALNPKSDFILQIIRERSS